MIYFTSDTHFCHENIIHLNDRPFKNYDDMQRTLIRNWNSLVTDRDEVYILGDLIYKGSGEDANQILKKLKGKKYLIIGNHDKYLTDPHFDTSTFEWIKDFYILNYNKMKFVLFHYPILEWPGYFKGNIHLYGHVHNCSKNAEQTKRLEILGNHAYNVGVDVNNYFPISITKILQICNVTN